MIERVLNLNQRTVSSIMTSRHDIEHIDLNAPEEEIRQLLERNQHTRLVVTDGDDAEDLLGVVHVIDLLQQSLRGEPLNLRVLIRQPLVFPETLPLLPALEQFGNARTHFAFVVDEFGSVEGIVTLSDVTETIAGNLPNEVEEIDARHDIQKNADGSWTANGHMPRISHHCRAVDGIFAAYSKTWRRSSGRGLLAQNVAGGKPSRAEGADYSAA